jgi:hypothetical protein
MVRCRFKNWHKKDMCLEKNGLCAQNMLFALGSIVNITLGERGLYDHFMSMKLFTLIINKMFIRVSKIM